MGIAPRPRPGNPVHSSLYYLIIHMGIVLCESAVMGLMGWVMSPVTQGQLTGGEDATGNLPGLVFLMGFFSWLNSAAVIGLWLTEVYNPPLTRALIQAFLLLPINGAAGFFLGWKNNWTVFLGSCKLGSILCKSVWKLVVRIEGVTTFLIGVVCVLTIIDILGSLRLWHSQRKTLKRLVQSTKAPYSPQ
ncbi:hypothetical protein FRB91_008239 [Serendipita sp. 411]|nr:hypothetical protein FRC19_010205 [Serendipita sp. 401]KAG8833366.1 hypothetical protein FRC18_003725 [Serendipita sp. 400]KAG8861373.1 hypothetical protein FRB91_008239 [Serendipita sp. 411]KAG9052945.1 hypothetical protein FS842_008990 [Serendipita sp. 407]